MERVIYTAVNEDWLPKFNGKLIWDDEYITWIKLEENPSLILKVGYVEVNGAKWITGEAEFIAIKIEKDLMVYSQLKAPGGGAP